MNSQGHSIKLKDYKITGKIHSSDEKSRIAKNAVSREIPIIRHNIKENMDTNLFNNYSKDFIKSQNDKFEHNVKFDVTSFEINHLKNQNSLLQQLIAELSHENNLLRRKFNDNSNSTI